MDTTAIVCSPFVFDLHRADRFHPEGHEKAPPPGVWCSNVAVFAQRLDIIAEKRSKCKCFFTKTPAFFALFTGLKEAPLLARRPPLGKRPIDQD